MTSSDGKGTKDDKPAIKLQTLSDGLETLRTQAGDIAETAITHAKDSIEQAKEVASEAYSSSRERASEAYAAALEKTKQAGKRASESVETNPMAVLFGGLAIGAAIGALLPRTEREAKILGGVSEKLNCIAREAAGAAREAGQDKLDELGLTREKARETVKSLLDSALAAASTAGSAAIDSAKQNKGRI